MLEARNPNNPIPSNVVAQCGVGCAAEVRCFRFDDDLSLLLTGDRWKRLGMIISVNSGVANKKTGKTTKATLHYI